MALTKKKCKFCGKPYQYGSERICSECFEAIDKTYVKVSEYLYENVDAPIDTIVEDTGTDERIILHLLREGRLQYTNSEASKIKCEQCGKSIASGRWCDVCSEKIKKRLNSQINGEQQKKKQGMHIKH